MFSGQFQHKEGGRFKLSREKRIILKQRIGTEKQNNKRKNAVKMTAWFQVKL